MYLFVQCIDRYYSCIKVQGKDFSVKIGHEKFPEKNQLANALIKFYNEKFEWIHIVGVFFNLKS